MLLLEGIGHLHGKVLKSLSLRSLVSNVSSSALVASTLSAQLHLFSVSNAGWL